MDRFKFILKLMMFLTLFMHGAAPASCQSTTEINALNGKAWELLLDRPMDARNFAMQAKEWSEKTRYLPGLADSYSTLAYLYCNEGAYQDGYKYYEECLRIRRTLGDSAKVANVFINLSIFKNTQGRYDEARSDATNAISLLEGVLKREPANADGYEQKVYALGQAFLNLSNIYSDFQDNILALEYARKGYEIQSRTHDKLWIAKAMRTMANRFYTAWEPKVAHEEYADSAKYYYRKALEYFANSDQDLISGDIADIYYDLAQIDLTLANFHSAWELLSQAEQEYQKMEPGSGQDAGFFFVALARGNWMLDYKNDGKAALTYFKRAYYLNSDDFVEKGAQIELLNQLSEAFSMLGQQDSAYYFKKLAAALSQSHFTDRLSKFQRGERSDWQQKLNAEIAQSALVRERQRYLTAVVLALILFIALLTTVALIVVRALRRRAEIARQKIQDMIGNLDARYLEGIESERDQIAEMLHDDLGGHSVANTWMLEALVEQLNPNTAPKALAEKVLANSKLLSESIRAFSHRLSSIYVQRSGLVVALEELCQNISQNGRLNVRLNVQPWEGNLDVSQEIQLLRILQELISNTVKYAKASEIYIHLYVDSSNFVMRYSDNGAGFDIKHALSNSSGMGMANIQKRVGLLQGKLDTGSEPGEGMWVVISFALVQGKSESPV